ncbi:Transcription initiation factor TFIID subunit 12, partial [Zancudomyces culisetae]
PSHNAENFAKPIKKTSSKADRRSAGGTGGGSESSILSKSKHQQALNLLNKQRELLELQYNENTGQVDGSGAGKQKLEEESSIAVIRMLNEGVIKVQNRLVEFKKILAKVKDDNKRHGVVLELIDKCNFHLLQVSSFIGSNSGLIMDNANSTRIAGMEKTPGSGKQPVVFVEINNQHKGGNTSLSDTNANKIPRLSQSGGAATEQPSDSTTTIVSLSGPITQVNAQMQREANNALSSIAPPPGSTSAPGTSLSGSSMVPSSSSLGEGTGGGAISLVGLDTSSLSTDPSQLRVLSKRKIQELVNEIDPNSRIEPEVEDLLCDIADEFIDSVVGFSCELARHRKSNVLEAKDIQLHLERNWNIRVPGFATDEIRTVKKSTLLPNYQQKLNAINYVKNLKRFD